MLAAALPAVLACVGAEEYVFLVITHVDSLTSLKVFATESTEYTEFEESENSL
jgi:hypothetical protein